MCQLAPKISGLQAGRNMVVHLTVARKWKQRDRRESRTRRNSTVVHNDLSLARLYLQIAHSEIEPQ